MLNFVFLVQIEQTRCDVLMSELQRCWSLKLYFIYWTHQCFVFHSPSTHSILDFTDCLQTLICEISCCVKKNAGWDENWHIQAHGISVGNLSVDIHKAWIITAVIRAYYDDNDAV